MQKAISLILILVFIEKMKGCSGANQLGGHDPQLYFYFCIINVVL